MKASGKIEMKTDGRDRFRWESDRSHESEIGMHIEMERGAQGWQAFFSFLDGDVATSAVSFDLGQGVRPNTLSRASQRVLVEEIVSRMGASLGLMKLIDMVSAHPLCRGVSVEFDGQEHAIVPTSSPSDIGAFVSAMIADNRRWELDSQPAGLVPKSR